MQRPEDTVPPFEDQPLARTPVVVPVVLVRAQGPDVLRGARLRGTGKRAGEKRQQIAARTVQAQEFRVLAHGRANVICRQAVTLGEKSREGSESVNRRIPFRSHAGNPVGMAGQDAQRHELAVFAAGEPDSRFPRGIAQHLQKRRNVQPAREHLRQQLEIDSNRTFPSSVG